MKNRPELMILIAVLVALVAGIICSAAACSMVTSATLNWGHHSSQPDNDWPFGDNGGGDEGRDSNSTPDDQGKYTEKDVPESMDIETDELLDDLQAVVNHDITAKLGLSDTDKVTASDLTKDTVAKPELKNGFVLGQVSGKVTITNMLGKKETVDYTSYYYADDPSAEKIVWYIYAYDLGSYDVMPEGFEEIAGDPMNVRNIIQGDLSSLGGLLGIDGRNETTNA